MLRGLALAFSMGTVHAGTNTCSQKDCTGNLECASQPEGIKRRNARKHGKEAIRTNGPRYPNTAPLRSRQMKRLVKKIIVRGLLLTLFGLCAAWGFVAYNAWRADPLQLWHTYVPQEMTVAEMDSADWQTYIQREDLLFAAVREHVTLRLPEEARVLMNRYYKNSLMHPPRLMHDWNRSYEFLPEGEIQGAAIFLHGLTDTPYSLRHVARLYTQKGFAAIGVRLPGHGTIPAGLTAATWTDWMAATRLAVREASRLAGPDKPLHIVGFSNGGALAVKYAMDTLEDPSLRKVDRLVLLSPMIGITRFAKFAGLTAVPAIFPAFTQAAWLGVMPEFNPFKYNSFPVNGARQSYQLCSALQSQIIRLSATEAFASLPSMLTFQSVLDYTVSTPAVLYHLYAYLPENGSELVLYDVNHASLLGGMMRPGAVLSLQRMMPRDSQRFTLSIVKNRAPDDQRTMLVTRKAGGMEEVRTDLDIMYPKGVFSLSHGAVPFPMDDALYGLTPSPEDASRYGINLGNMAIRGERGALLVPMDAMLRMSSNPFFTLLCSQIEKAIDAPATLAAYQIPATPPAYPDEIKSMFDAFLQEADREEFSGATIF